MGLNIYHEINAENHHKLGLALGKEFEKPIYCAVRELCRKHKIEDSWYMAIYESGIKMVEKNLPKVAEELKGYAKGAKVKLHEMWWIAMGYDIDNICDNQDWICRPRNHCTTVIANGGLLIGHNEDDSPESADTLFIVKRILPELTILELYYAGGLGGNSISINSRGYVHSVNSLNHSAYREGLPRDLIARWISEAGQPKAYYSQMKDMPRMSGYSHNMVSLEGKVWNIESCAEKAGLAEEKSPYCHTNHFLRKIEGCWPDEDVCASIRRYRRAEYLAKQHETMTLSHMKELLSDTLGWGDEQIFNENTIGRVIVDLEALKAHIWLSRDADRDTDCDTDSDTDKYAYDNWRTYDISFMRGNH